MRIRRRGLVCSFFFFLLVLVMSWTCAAGGGSLLERERRRRGLQGYRVEMTCVYLKGQSSAAMQQAAQ
jgi:hypothetical protein